MEVLTLPALDLVLLVPPDRETAQAASVGCLRLFEESWPLNPTTNHLPSKRPYQCHAHVLPGMATGSMHRRRVFPVSGDARWFAAV